MPRNGAGQYTLPAGNPVVTGQIISSTTQNNTMNDVASALSASISNDGQTPVIANLPMNGFKHTGAADGVSPGDYATIRQLSASGADLLGVAHLVPSMAQLRLLAKTGSGAAIVEGYYSAADGGGGSYVYVSSDTTSGAVITASTSGSTLTVTAVASGTLSVGQLISRSDTGAAVGYITALGTGTGGTGTYTLSTSGTISSMTMMADNGGTVIVAADGGRWKIANTMRFITVSMFGAKGDGVSDDTIPVQNAINYAAASNLGLSFNNGIYLVSELSTTYNSFTRAFHIDLGGSTILSSGTSSNPLITLLNAKNVFISNGVLDGNWGLTQTQLVKIWGNNGTTGSSYNVLTNIVFRNAQYGFQAGDPFRPNEPSISENTLIGCNCIGVLNPAIVYGVQAELNIVASQMTASTEAWVTYPSSYKVNALTAVGGNIRMLGGEITSYVDNGISIQPIVSSSGNLYGKAFLSGAWIEVQNRIGVAENPSSISSTVGGVISLNNCSGSIVSDSQAAFDTSADYKGDIRVPSGNYLWANTTRTKPNVNSSSTTSIYVGSNAFSPYVGTVPPTPGFLSGISAYVGGTVYYDSVVRQTALLVKQGTLQSIPNATWTKIQLQNEIFDTANAFDATTNYRFQPQSAGYYQFNAQFQVAASNVPAGVDLYLNGASTGYSIGSFQSGVLNGTATVSRVLFLNGSTDYVEVYGFQASGGSANSVTAITQLSASYVRAA